MPDIQQMRTFLDRDRVPFQTRGESRAKPSFRDETDINNIMRRFEKTGVIDHYSRVQGHYGDYSVVPDYQQALNAVINAREMFMSLPAAIRKRFDNDPGEFLAFAEDPANEDAMIEMGLMQAKPAPTAPEVEPRGETPAPAPAPDEG